MYIKKNLEYLQLVINTLSYTNQKLNTMLYFIFLNINCMNTVKTIKPVDFEPVVEVVGKEPVDDQFVANELLLPMIFRVAPRKIQPRLLLQAPRHVHAVSPRSFVFVCCFVNCL